MVREISQQVMLIASLERGTGYIFGTACFKSRCAFVMLEGEEAKRLSAFADPHRSVTQRSRGSWGSTGECSATQGEKATPRTWWGAASPQGRLLEALSVEQHLHELWRLTP